MWSFLKKIFSSKKGDITVVVLDDNEPEQSSTFKLESTDIIKLTVLIVGLSILLTTVIFFVTPLGTFYSYQQNDTLRDDVIDITEKVMALRDSLHARDYQLQNLKKVLLEVPDTTFQTRAFSEGTIDFEQGMGEIVYAARDVPAFEMMTRHDIINSDILKREPDFPAPFPMEGTLTQGFNPDHGHNGIDIAAREQTEFRAISNGTVIKAGWTFNYGHVVYLHHGGGYISVYKHGANLNVEEGDIVLTGDLLGRIGDKGALSFGSHLHLEIWKNGVAQDPQLYLIK